MKNIDQKGAVGLIVIILILLAGGIGFYFYNADKTDDAKEAITGEIESNEMNGVDDEAEEPVGFEEEPKNLPVEDTQSGGAPTNPNIPVFTEEPIIGAEVSIKNFSFGATVTIKAGQSVEWTNSDSVGHTVTSDTGLFDSGNLAQGNIYSRKFDQPGTYTYFCKPHPNMKGTVIVK